MTEKEIEVGEYIRTNYGRICKVINNNYFMPIYLECENETLIDKTKIVKHSKNIIDLIEVGDIVFTEDFNGYDFIDIYSVEMLEALKQDVKNSIKIKSILTHEQYEKSCYKVEE